MQKNKKRFANVLSVWLASVLLVQVALADSSPSFTIDMSRLNSSGEVKQSGSYQVNDTITGLDNTTRRNSSAFQLDSGLVTLEQYCGNGILEVTEGCDDGNRLSGDGCSSVCLPEVVPPPAPPTPSPAPPTGGGGGGYDVNNPPPTSTPSPAPGAGAICGNGKLEGLEQCDDGNTLSGDGCDASCHLELKPAAPGTVCGNGKLERGEQCDDGNTLSGDGCNANCALELFNAPLGLKIESRPEKRVDASQNWGVFSKLVFYNRDLHQILLQTFVDLNNTGWSAFDTAKLVPGNYDISIKGRSHLTKVLRNYPIDANTTTIDFTGGGAEYMIAGDVHESKDDFINGLDLSATVKQLYTDNIDADLNHDGTVNGLDLSIVLTNLYKRGERI